MNLQINKNNIFEANLTIETNETNEEKYFLMFDSLKVVSEGERTLIGNSKTSTSSAFSDKYEQNSKNISDDDDPMVKDFINKKRKRINKKCK